MVATTSETKDVGEGEKIIQVRRSRLTTHQDLPRSKNMLEHSQILIVNSFVAGHVPFVVRHTQKKVLSLIKSI